MERLIEFRGKDKESGLLVYGSLWVQSERSILIHSEDGWTFIYPETVGQFTGLLDWDKNRLFEGDIVEFEKIISGEERAIGEIRFNPAYMKYEIKYHTGNKNRTTNLWGFRYIKVIGNIHIGLQGEV